jgi:hypothetical protein
MSSEGEPRSRPPLDIKNIEELISKLDRLHREKPAGFFAFITACHSSMPIINFVAGEEDEKTK